VIVSPTSPVGDVAVLVALLGWTLVDGIGVGVAGVGVEAYDGVGEGEPLDVGSPSGRHCPRLSRLILDAMAAGDAAYATLRADPGSRVWRPSVWGRPAGGTVREGTVCPGRGG
jgi:hypothetical protein